MKIILKQDFEILGNAGEIKEVKDGYARNFLIPRGIALHATASNIKHFEDIRKQQTRKTQRETEKAKKTLDQLEKVKIEIKAKVGEEDKLFGSVTTQMIYDRLVELGFEGLDKKKIMLHEHIKTVGEHPVEIKLYTGVVAKLMITVKNELETEQVVKAQEEVKTEEHSAE